MLAVEGVLTEQNDVKVSTYLPDHSANIIKCLEADNNSRPLLEAMAKYGFAAVTTPADHTAQLISEKNIGGVAAQKAANVGISETQWDGTVYEHALIPSSQSARFQIAMVLEYMRENKRQRIA